MADLPGGGIAVSLDGVRTRIEYVNGWSVAVIEFDERMDVLSSCFLNGGKAETSTIVIIQVDPDYHHDPVGDARKVLDELGLPDDTVCFMTAAEVYRVFTEERVNHNDYDCLALVTAGLSNQVVAGEEILDWDERKKLSAKRHKLIADLYPPGTINIIGVVSEPMTDAAKVNSFIAMTEAKSAAMHDLGYRETGTTSDAIAIVCPKEGNIQSYAGTGFGFGLSLAKAVRSAVRKALIKRHDFPVDMKEEEMEELRRRYL